MLGIHNSRPQQEGQHEKLGFANILCILRGNGWVLRMPHQVRSCSLVPKDIHLLK